MCRSRVDPPCGQVCKLLLCLDGSDPQGALLCIDYYALRAGAQSTRPLSASTRSLTRPLRFHRWRRARLAPAAAAAAARFCVDVTTRGRSGMRSEASTCAEGLGRITALRRLIPRECLAGHLLMPSKHRLRGSTAGAHLPCKRRRLGCAPAAFAGQASTSGWCGSCAATGRASSSPPPRAAFQQRWLSGRQRCAPRAPISAPEAARSAHAHGGDAWECPGTIS